MTRRAVSQTEELRIENDGVVDLSRFLVQAPGERRFRLDARGGDDDGQRLAASKYASDMASSRRELECLIAIGVTLAEALTRSNWLPASRAVLPQPRLERHHSSSTKSHLGQFSLVRVRSERLPSQLQLDRVIRRVRRSCRVPR